MRLRSHEVLWTSGTRRCVVEMPEALPHFYFVRVFDATKVIFTQRCDTISDAAELGETLRQLSEMTLSGPRRPLVS